VAKKQTILAIMTLDGALLGGACDSQLCRTLGTRGLSHEMIAEGIEAGTVNDGGQGLLDIVGIDLAARSR